MRRNLAVRRHTKARRRRSSLRIELGGLFLFGLAALTLISLWSPTGWLGRQVGFGARWLLGASAWAYLLVLIGTSLSAMKNRSWPPLGRRLVGIIGLLLLFSTALGEYSPLSGGTVGRLLADLLHRLLGNFGMGLFLLILTLAFLILATGLSLAEPLLWLEGLMARGLGRMGRAAYDYVYPETAEPSPPASTVPATIRPTPPPWEPEPAPTMETMVPTPPETPEPPETPTLTLAGAENEGYRLPPLSLLSRGDRRGRKVDQGEKGRILEETLRSFGVSARVVDFTQGPMVTRFELQPAPGVKVSRIVSLADDLALAMAASDIRIEAPIPGKAAVGVEVPNSELSPVLLREVLESNPFLEHPSPLAVALGKDIGGETVVTSLDRMPHLLIAGATGAGKSVSISTIIASLLYKASPSQVKLLLIDPKVVELSHFNGIPHLLTPVVTDPKKAAGILRAMVRQMEDRYELFAKAGVRDIGKYNQVRPPEERLPFVVIIIDELADLMMVASVEVEDHICRLAQMARAAGIHMVVATQRPSVDVITGLIKANIPSRIAFAVSSQVDSRTILDGAGAERLLGRGDMLFAPIGASKPVRVQGAYVSEREMENIIEFIRGQSGPEYAEELEHVEEGGTQPSQPVDELFPEAVKVVMEAGQASASYLQRKMRIGYSRAARLVDAMEERGIVGPSENSKAREVRMSAAEYHRLFSSDS